MADRYQHAKPQQVGNLDSWCSQMRSGVAPIGARLLVVARLPFMTARPRNPRPAKPATDDEIEAFLNHHHDQVVPPRAEVVAAALAAEGILADAIERRLEANTEFWIRLVVSETASDDGISEGDVEGLLRGTEVRVPERARASVCLERVRVLASEYPGLAQWSVLQAFGRQLRRVTSRAVSDGRLDIRELSQDPVSSGDGLHGSRTRPAPALSAQESAAETPDTPSPSGDIPTGIPNVDAAPAAIAVTRQVLPGNRGTTVAGPAGPIRILRGGWKPLEVQIFGEWIATVATEVSPRAKTTEDALRVLGLRIGAQFESKPPKLEFVLQFLRGELIQTEFAELMFNALKKVAPATASSRGRVMEMFEVRWTAANGTATPQGTASAPGPEGRSLGSPNG